MISCKKGKRTNYEIISIDYTPLKQYICPLETTNQNLMGNISKIEIYKGLFYILDESSNYIYVHDSTGKYINQLNKTGRGPDEYIHINDLKINENGIFILDYPQQAILQYGPDMSFIRKIRFNFYPAEFKLNQGDFFIFSEKTNQKDDYSFYLTTDTGENKDQFIKRKKIKNRKYNFQFSNVFCFNSDSLFSPRYSNYIYSLNNKDFIYKLNFKDKTFPEDKQEINDYNVYDEQFPFIVRENIYQQGPFIFISYFYRQKRYFACYDTHNKQLKSCGSYLNDILPDFRFFPRWQNRNYWIDCIDSYTLLNQFPSVTEEFNQLKNLKDTDNPVLIIYQMKTDSGKK